jgi:hypothetical protein
VHTCSPHTHTHARRETIYEPEDPAIVANLGLSHEDEVRSQTGKEVDAAIREGRSVWISYRGGTHDRAPREVKPVRWQPHTAKSLFVGICGITGGEKEFYVHLIQELRHETWVMTEGEGEGEEEEDSEEKGKKKQKKVMKGGRKQRRSQPKAEEEEEDKEGEKQEEA